MSEEQESIKAWADEARSREYSEDVEERIKLNRVDSRIAGEVLQEMGRQLEKWGVQHHPDGTDKEYEELAYWSKLQNDATVDDDPDRLTWNGILQEEVFEALAEYEDQQKLRTELVQVAAVACSWIRDIDSRAPKPATGILREAA